MSYIIRFEGIGSTSVHAENLVEAIEHGEMFERSGKTNIVVSRSGGGNLPLGELRKLMEGGAVKGVAAPARRSR